jgi:hypothetical protein
MTTHDLLRSAIRDRRQVVAYYQGHRREFCPHVLGTKAGKARVLVFQFGGETSHGPIVSPQDGDWRCFEVAELLDVELRDGEWHSGIMHRGQQRCVDVVEVEAGGTIGTLARR